MNRLTEKREVSLLLLILAFAAVYIIWGSTYLAIVYALKTMPPFLLSGTRFLFCGILLYLWSSWRDKERPQLIHWGNAFIIGACLFLIGNGGVVWAEQHIPSGSAALLITTEPIWVVLIGWLWDNNRPNRAVILGLIIGFIGTLVLVGTTAITGLANSSLLGSLVVIVGSFFWAAGSVYLSRAKLPSSPFLMTAMQMIAGGILMTTMATIKGEWSQFNIAAVSQESWLAWGYLAIFGSLVAFTAYSWLARVAPPSRVSTYAYVNPVIAVFLGWALNSEVISPRTIIAAILLISAVVLITKNIRPVNNVKEESVEESLSAIIDEKAAYVTK